MTWLDWYNDLEKPRWTPEPSTIGLIWQILYPIILVTFGFVFVQAIRKKLPWKVALPFGINLVANLIFTPIQFGLRNLPLAAVDILVVWATIIWMSFVDLEAPQVGRGGAGAVFRVGLDCDRAATDRSLGATGSNDGEFIHDRNSPWSLLHLSGTADQVPQHDGQGHQRHES